MVKTLRITGFLLAAVAAAGVLVLVVLGAKGDPEIQAFLDQEGVIEQLRHRAGTQTDKEDTISPLVAQARAFARRIDPPPPPPPPRQETPRQETSRQPARQEPVRPPAPPQVTSRYELVATAAYPDRPELSLALIKPATGPAKWHRQGERIGHLEVGTIAEGRVVLLQDGRENTELFVPAPPQRHKPLLKTASAVRTPGAPAAVETPGAGPDHTEPATTTDIVRTAQERRDRVQAGRTPPTATRAPVTRAPAPTAPRVPSTEEQKDSIQQSITSIEAIMSRSDPHISEEERRKEQEAWTQLLNVLTQEKEALGSPDNEETSSVDEPNESERQETQD